MDTDDRLYLLQRTHLPADLRQLVREADIAFLRDNESTAIWLLDSVELECVSRGITIHNPDPFNL